MERDETKGRGDKIGEGSTILSPLLWRKRVELKGGEDEHTRQSDRAGIDVEVIVEVGVKLEVENNAAGSLVVEASVVAEDTRAVCAEHLHCHQRKKKGRAEERDKEGSGCVHSSNDGDIAIVDQGARLLELDGASLDGSSARVGEVCS